MGDDGAVFFFCDCDGAAPRLRTREIERPAINTRALIRERDREREREREKARAPVWRQEKE